MSSSPLSLPPCRQNRTSVLFTTLTYWLFFLIVAVGYFALPRRVAIVALAIAGFVFYGFWNVALVLLLAGSTLFNFLAGIVVDGASGNRRRLTLAVAGAGNLATPDVFKYIDFFFSSFATCPASGVRPLLTM